VNLKEVFLQIRMIYLRISIGLVNPFITLQRNWGLSLKVFFIQSLDILVLKL